MTSLLLVQGRQFCTPNAYLVILQRTGKGLDTVHSVEGKRELMSSRNLFKGERALCLYAY